MQRNSSAALAGGGAIRHVSVILRVRVSPTGAAAICALHHCPISINLQAASKTLVGKGTAQAEVSLFAGRASVGGEELLSENTHRASPSVVSETPHACCGPALKLRQHSVWPRDYRGLVCACSMHGTSLRRAACLRTTWRLLAAAPEGLRAASWACSRCTLL
jgi:hypothetical protein